MSEPVYRLLTLNGDTLLEEKSSGNLSEVELLVEATMIAAGRLRYFLFKIPEEGQPEERVCENIDALKEAMVELTAGPPGKIYIYQGIKIEIGPQETTIPLCAGGDELVRVPIVLPSPSIAEDEEKEQDEDPVVITKDSEVPPSDESLPAEQPDEPAAPDA